MAPIDTNGFGRWRLLIQTGSVDGAIDTQLFGRWRLFQFDSVDDVNDTRLIR